MRIGGPQAGDVNLLQSESGIPRLWDVPTNNAQAFIRGTTLAGAAGLFGHIQCKLPTGSTVNAWIDQISFSVGSAALVDVSPYGTDLNTLVGGLLRKDTPMFSGQCDIRTQTAGSLLGSVGHTFSCVANETYIWTLNRPFRLQPGFGLLMQCRTVNVQLTAGFEVREI